MIPPCPHEVFPAILATTLLIDIRNFTPNLNAAQADEGGINGFCRFLFAFYALCLEASLLAVPPDLRLRPPLSLSSTGDGVLILFTHEAHVRHGFLAAILLHVALQQHCAGYNARQRAGACPQTSFGIGVESGQVSRVRAQHPGDPGSLVVDTYIGPCINVAARAQAVSKFLHRTRTVIAQTTNTLLCQTLFREHYEALMARALDEGLGDPERLALYDRMNELNRHLCLTFIQHHHLTGVEQPMPLFRLASSAIHLGNPRFAELLAVLTAGASHLAEVMDFLHRRGGNGRAEV
jgi:class 3 adenylate cyclase